MEIIKAGEPHIAYIQEIAYTTWPVTFGEILGPAQLRYMLEWMYSTHALRDQMTVRQHTFLLAKEGHIFTGFASIEFNYNGEPVTKIHKLYILPETQGKGTGKRLLKEIEGMALEKGNPTITLNVNRYNSAVKFYQKLGFVIKRSEDIDIGNGYLMEDYVMDLSLP